MTGLTWHILALSWGLTSDKPTAVASDLHLAAEGQWSGGRGIHWHQHLYPPAAKHQEPDPGGRCVQIDQLAAFPGGVSHTVPCQQGGSAFITYIIIPSIDMLQIDWENHIIVHGLDIHVSEELTNGSFHHHYYL